MVTRPVGLSRDLPPKRVMRANLDGHDMVVWRASDGTISAWNNRCPHRGMALSHGFVRGKSLACLYHGWHFSANGQCNHIPAHPDLEPPETIRTRAYSAVEESGVIWVSSDDEAVADPLDLLPLRSFIIDATETAVRAIVPSTPYRGCAPAPKGDGIYDIGAAKIAFLTNPMCEATHVTVLVDKETDNAGLRDLSRWCEAVRRAAETEAIP